MVSVAIIGLGFMGRTHYRAYERIEDARVVAVADLDERRAAGDLSAGWGNLGDEGPQRLPMDRIHGTTDLREAVTLPDVDVVDLCVPTPAHRELATAALEAGKHVILEKPLAANLEDAEAIVSAAKGARGRLFPAMCMRYWPQWAWLKRAADEGTYGAVRAATFLRVCPPPPGWFRDGTKSGGALMDLHIHDTDFVHDLFGVPRAVTSRGYSVVSGGVDHVATLYDFEQVPLVASEGGWAVAEGGGFTMRYAVSFEGASATFDAARDEPLMLTRDGKTEPVACEAADGYELELRDFIDCVKRDRGSDVVTAEQALESMRIADAERRSVETGETVRL